MGYMPQVGWPEPTELAGEKCHREALFCGCCCSPTEIHHLFTAQQMPSFLFPSPAVPWVHEETCPQTFLKLSQAHSPEQLIKYIL